MNCEDVIWFVVVRVLFNEEFAVNERDVREGIGLKAQYEQWLLTKFTPLRRWLQLDVQDQLFLSGYYSDYLLFISVGDVRELLSPFSINWIFEALWKKLKKDEFKYSRRKNLSNRISQRKKLFYRDVLSRLWNISKCHRYFFIFFFKFDLCKNVCIEKMQLL